jgi:hypothetical protein
MSKSKPILVGLCVVALGFSAYEGYRAYVAESQLNSAKVASAQQEKQASAAEAQIHELEQQVKILKARTDGLGKFVDALNSAAAGSPGGPANALAAQFEPATKPDDSPPIPANEVKAERLITPLSAEELAHRVDLAYQRTPETLTPVTAQDLPNMPSAYEWGSGSDRRMWRMADASTYLEVYPDGSYSVFPILGRATVNGTAGVITTKDDGSLDVFIPDKGGRPEHLIRFASPNAQWSDYQAMQNVE